MNCIKFVSLLIIFVSNVSCERPLPNDSDKLIALLDNKEKDYSIQARALRKIVDLHYEKEAISNLDSPSPMIRGGCVQALGLMKSQNGFKKIVSMNNDADPWVRMWVAFSLGEYKNAEAIRVLNVMQNDDNETVRIQVEKSLANVK
jgi:HEAT repeat protein